MNAHPGPEHALPQISGGRAVTSHPRRGLSLEPRPCPYPAPQNSRLCDEEGSCPPTLRPHSRCQLGLLLATELHSPGRGDTECVLCVAVGAEAQPPAAC